MASIVILELEHYSITDGLLLTYLRRPFKVLSDYLAGLPLNKTLEIENVLKLLHIFIVICGGTSSS